MNNQILGVKELMKLKLPQVTFDGQLEIKEGKTSWRDLLQGLQMFVRWAYCDRC